jgi:Cu+-exporting ATPase
VGDRLVIRNGELIPADAKLISGPALIDYSFVTGESEPVEKKADDYLYAGGRQMGGAIEVEMVKAVSQSYLTSLWNQDAFRKEKSELLNQITNTYSQRFTKIVIGVAVGAAVFWAFVNPALGGEVVHFGADRGVSVCAGVGGAVCVGHGAARSCRGGMFI